MKTSQIHDTKTGRPPKTNGSQISFIIVKPLTIEKNTCLGPSEAFNFSKCKSPVKTKYMYKSWNLNSYQYSLRYPESPRMLGMKNEISPENKLYP